MPLNNDSLATIRERIANNLERTIRGEANGVPFFADAHTAGTGYTEIANAVAAVAHGLYGNQAYIAEQIFTLTMDQEQLLEKAAEYSIYRIPAAFAKGVATVTGNDGRVIEAGNIVQHKDGRQYRVIDEATIINGSAVVNLIALEAGISSNLTSGSLTFIEPITGVDGDLIEATVAGGAEIEDIERVRERVLERQQQPPLGGKDYDYVAWAKQAHVDVTKAWITSHENGIGSIVLRFVIEGLANPIPTQAHIDAVRSYLLTVRPSGLRNFSVEAPTALELGLAFTSLTPNSLAVQGAITAELRDLLRREATGGSTILLSQIRESISAANGEQDHVINLTENVIATPQQFPVLGDIQWPVEQQ